MRILLVCQYYYPEQFKVNDISAELVKLGHEVTVLTGLPNYPSGVIPDHYRQGKNRIETINGVEVVRVPLIPRGKSKLRLVLNYVSFALTASWRALSMQMDFDVILVYQLSPVFMVLPGLVAKARSRKPLVLYCQDLWPDSAAAAGVKKGSFIYTILLWVSRWLYHRGDKVIVSSSLFKDYFRDVIGIKDPVHYLPVYAEDLFEDIPPNDVGSEIINLLFAGNIGEMQSVETIIMAAGLLRADNRLKWHIVGEGSSRQKCEDLARDLNLTNITFHGQHPLESMPLFYSKADVFLLTLKSNELTAYTLPNKVQSYLAAGRPILGAIDGESRAVIEAAACGACCQAEDHEGLASLIQEYTKDKKGLESLGPNSKEYYREHFLKASFLKRLENLLKEVVKGEGVCLTEKQS